MNIHFIAIGGSIMHGLAIALKNNGHNVSGSDDYIYEPSKSNLVNNNLLPKHNGWNKSTITKDLDMVILGMHAKLDNPELIMALDLEVPILSFPEFISKYTKSNKKVVIAGSHGKTTITSMILHVLKDCNIPCDYLVGAKITGLNNLVKIENNNIMIIEGDEYLSSALDNQPKFTHYNPDILVVTGVAWDHINVFPTLDSYQETFRLLIKDTNPKSTIFYCSDDPFLSEICLDQSNCYPYHLPEYEIDNNICVLLDDGNKFNLRIFGQHNLYNIQVSQKVCLELGISKKLFLESISKFTGASRRLSLIKKTSNSSVYFDFAHSPSKVSATISAVREINKKRYLITCLELHTFSSLNDGFLPQYNHSFIESDEVWIYYSSDELKRKNIGNINAHIIKSCITHKNLIILDNKVELTNTISSISLHHTNVLFMSSGNFSGIDIERIVNASNL